MISLIGFLAFIGGIAVLVGQFFPTLVNYPLIYIGAGLSILGGLIDHFRRNPKF